ncbi:hypothetical protein P4126_33410 [Pseudomonas aeruginosa]|uniref:hypothetical protein n=1 Tax=Pseudomonas TaxID=286 RepID=UPI000FC41D26|nr:MULTISPECIES: hypothetical protein [Pseudomonas]HDS0928919.1 hypothetical protein [Pseudomonas putida]EKT9493348.1 hypothetical protein [Pseudomonas aeruginosa]EKU2925344.1 hypothetical protein [Pseudomonas aeruginosa]MCU9196834.1 hypothetical protein [Pseudomonas aeruginosa]MCU9228852.1 hypothetical protein [Pseudomonas aeruginosa]
MAPVLSSTSEPRLNLGPHFFNALSWVRQTTFPADLECSLVALGTAPALAQEIAVTYSHSMYRDIVRFYEEYAYSVSSEEWQQPLAAYISARLADYDRYGKHELPMAKYLQTQLDTRQRKA